MNNYNSLKAIFLTILAVLISACKESELNIGMPNVSTEIVTNITSNSAYCGGNVTSDGGAMVTTRGVVWSTSQNPTISLNTKTIDGDSLGKFKSEILDLTPNTTYYIRAYATNIIGTTYGIELSFKTPMEATNGTFTDERDGNIYKWVKIGKQIWMAENLRYFQSNTRFQYSYETPAYYALNAEIYGYLYNWSAARESAPNGWHLPSEEEWTELINYLGGSSIAGGKLKEKGDQKFSALLGGEENVYYSENNIGLRGVWWSASSIYKSYQDYSYNAFILRLTTGSESMIIEHNKRSFCSVRCVKN